MGGPGDRRRGGERRGGRRSGGFCDGPGRCKDSVKPREWGSPVIRSDGHSPRSQGSTQLTHPKRADWPALGRMLVTLGEARPTRAKSTPTPGGGFWGLVGLVDCASPCEPPAAWPGRASPVPPGVQGRGPRLCLGTAWSSAGQVCREGRPLSQALAPNSASGLTAVLLRRPAT